MFVKALIWYIIWLNWLHNCREICNWRGLKKHKFCWFGCLDRVTNRLYHLLAFFAARAYCVCLAGCVCPLYSCWFDLWIKSCCCCTLPAVVSHLPKSNAECLQHLPLHPVSYYTENKIHRAFWKKVLICKFLFCSIVPTGEKPTLDTDRWLVPSKLSNRGHTQTSVQAFRNGKLIPVNSIALYHSPNKKQFHFKWRQLR